MSARDVPFDQNAVPSSQDEAIPFGIETVDYQSESGIEMEYLFSPEYYPNTLTQTSKNEIERTSGQCEGEDVYIKQNKNSTFHINGIILARSISVLRKIQNHSGKVTLISPLAGTDEAECVVKKVEIGEIEGWDQIEKQWQFDYTIDLVSTGSNGGDNGPESQIVSEALN